MNTYVIPTAAVQLFVVRDESYYPIDLAARLSQMPRHRVLVCCKRGLVAPLIDPDNGSYFFDAASIRLLQRIQYLHTDCGVNFTGIEIILGLVTELERVRGQEP
jgi:DNA-binding transcriptional MerR regulator